MVGYISHFSSTMSRLVAFTILSFVISVPLIAGGNSPPTLISGSVAPEQFLSGEKVVFNSQWEDADGDFIVDVRVRYREQVGAASVQPVWSERVLDFIPGSSLSVFSKEFVLDGRAGRWEFQFRASDSEFLGGPIKSTTPWIDGGDFILSNLRHGTKVRCVGPDFFQPLPNPDVVAPTAEITGASTTLEGENVLLSASATVDVASGGFPYYRWCTSRGDFTEQLSAPDYSSVEYRAPSLPGEDEIVEISLEVRDGLGNVAEEVFVINVSEAGDFDPKDPPPVVAIRSPREALVDSPYPIYFEVEDTNREGRDTTHSVNSKIYVSASEGPFELLAPGIRGNAGGASGWWVPRERRANAGSFSWTPTNTGTFRLKIVTDDGNQEVSAISDEFLVLNRDVFSIFGFVSEDSGQPLVNVRVEGVPASGSILEATSTAPTGSYSLEGFTEGLVELSASREGYTFVPERIVVEISTENPRVQVDFLGSMDSGGDHRPVNIDIKPGSDENPINYSSNGKIPVAILSASDFNAPAEVDQPTLTFGRTGNEESLHYRGNGEPNCSGDEDHNGDGLNDLMCHFHTPIAGFQPGDTEGILRGLTLAGEAFEGRDNITIVGPGVFSDGFDSGGFGSWSNVVGGGNN